ncbi:cytochrome b561 and DOMON domain-containing protein At4g17280-like [Bidens hawaiensis]|uniref:cytochrome b561 and DOMON domain-containing protein At4g17280-like n=1 Tax=Bidens hawaiensis TaxID=980011 RepID=UPI00404B88F3
MAKILNVFLCVLLSSFAAMSSAQSCNNYTFSGNQIYATCVSLPVLNSYLHWNYHPNGTVDVAFRHTGATTSQWVSWALNVDGSGMIGAQAVVAVTGSTGAVRVYTLAIKGYATGLQESSLSFNVSDMSAERVNGDLVVYASLVLPNGRTRFNHVWQVGLVNNGVPGIQSISRDNRSAVGEVDFITGLAKVSGGGSVGGSRQRQKNTHGVLNAFSWGVLMPIGAMSARYLKVFNVANPAWFYIHAATQTSAYVVGVAGWATGLKLGSQSTGVKYNAHRNIGIILFAFGTLQVLALLLRPKPDNKYRFYWNIYHRGLGYAVIILSVYNVYEGLGILEPEKKWKNAYTGIISSLAVITVLCEALTWFIVSKRKKEEKQAGSNEANGQSAMA